MDRRQIEQALGYLGQKLTDLQTHATLILFGGALMVTQIGNRKSTRDIDDSDIQALGLRLSIQTQAEAWSLVNAYTPPPQLRMRSSDTTQAIARCFRP